MKTFFSFAFILSILLSIPVYSQWQMMNSPLATPDIRKVAYHPDGYILAITSANEVFRSDNNGENWQIVSTLDDEATSLAISPTDIIYAGTYGGYFASTDDGVTWNEKQLFSPVNYVTDIEFNSLGYIFMSQYSYNTAYIWISTDGGNNWNISTNLGSPILSLAKDSSENIYAMTIYGSIYKSSDNGFSWQFLTSIGYYPDDLEIDTNNIFYLADSYDGIYKSTDLGISWSLILETNWPVYFDNIFLDANNNIYGFYISNDSNVFNGIIFSSDGGENWENINLSGIKISDLISENNTIFTGTEKGLQKLSVINSDWE